MKLSVGFRSALLAVALTFGSLLGAAPASADDTTCPDGNVCFWSSQNYQGDKRVYGNIWAGQWLWVNNGHNYHSMKNRFTNRAVRTAKPNGNQLCTIAGSINPAAPEFTVFLIGGPGSTC